MKVNKIISTGIGEITNPLTEQEQSNLSHQKNENT